VLASDSSASFGERLREHRRIAEITQEELANRAGVSPRSISEIERGSGHVPRRETVALLGAGLGLTVAEQEALQVLADRDRRTQDWPVEYD